MAEDLVTMMCSDSSCMSKTELVRLRGRRLDADGPWPKFCNEDLFVVEVDRGRLERARRVIIDEVSGADQSQMSPVFRESPLLADHGTTEAKHLYRKTVRVIQGGE
jgi:hypothetical protein